MSWTYTKTTPPTSLDGNETGDVDTCIYYIDGPRQGVANWATVRDQACKYYAWKKIEPIAPVPPDESLTHEELEQRRFDRYIKDNKIPSEHWPMLRKIWAYCWYYKEVL